jgi:hypothetical protein
VDEPKTNVVSLSLSSLKPNAHNHPEEGSRETSTNTDFQDDGRRRAEFAVNVSRPVYDINMFSKKII